MPRDKNRIAKLRRKLIAGFFFGARLEKKEERKSETAFLRKKGASILRFLVARYALQGINDPALVIDRQGKSRS